MFSALVLVTLDSGMLHELLLLLLLYSVVQQAANALSQLKQSPQPRTAKELQAVKKREEALKSLANAVAGSDMLQREDKDVRLVVAICVTELFRVMAPEWPFEDTHLRVSIMCIIVEICDVFISPFSVCYL